MNKSVIETTVGRKKRIILGLNSSSSSSDNSEESSQNFNRHNSRQKRRGRGRPPKKMKKQHTGGRKSMCLLLEDEDELSDDLSPKLPVKRGRPPKLKLMDEAHLDQAASSSDEGLYHRVGKRRRRGGRVVD